MQFYVLFVAIFKFVITVQASPTQYNQVSPSQIHKVSNHEVLKNNEVMDNVIVDQIQLNHDNVALFNKRTLHHHKRGHRSHNNAVFGNARNILKRPKRSNKNATTKGSVVETLDKTMSESQFDGSYDKTRHRTEGQTPTTDGIINTTSDYVLIAMIVAMMFCMTLCCLCLFCRSSSRLSICGINFELNDRQNSLAHEDLSEIHEVVPLTPTTADINRLPDIDSLLRNDAPPPLYSEIITKRNSSKQKLDNSDQLKMDKIVEANENPKKLKSKKISESQSKKNAGSCSSTSSSNHKPSWRRNGLFNSLRKKKSQTADTNRTTANSKPIPIPEQPQEVFIYDANEADDDVFI